MMTQNFLQSYEIIFISYLLFLIFLLPLLPKYNYQQL